MTSLSAAAVICREGLISIIRNRRNHSSRFIKDRKIKREDINLTSEQIAGITSAFFGGDNIVCLPTGYGKSIKIYRIDLKSSLRCHSLHSEHTRVAAGKSEEFTCTIDRIASAKALRILKFIHLKEDPPSCNLWLGNTKV